MEKHILNRKTLKLQTQSAENNKNKRKTFAYCK